MSKIRLSEKKTYKRKNTTITISNNVENKLIIHNLKVKKTFYTLVGFLK